MGLRSKIMYHYEVSVESERDSFEIFTEHDINENQVFIVNGKYYLAKEVDDNYILAESITSNAIEVYKVVKG